MNLFTKSIEVMQTTNERSTFDILKGDCGHIHGFVYVSQACCFICPDCGNQYEIQDETE